MKFFRISTDEGKKKKFAYGINLYEPMLQRIECPVCNTTRNIPVDEDQNLRLALTNNHYPDFLGYIYYKMISEKAAEVLKNENVNGYLLSPVETVPLDAITSEEKKEFRSFGNKVNKFATDPPTYHLLKVTGKAELHEKTNVIIEPCPSCGFAKIAEPGKNYFHPDSPFYIQRSSWDGSDFFVVPYFPFVYLCSQRFLEIYNKHHLSGLLFREVEGI